jgi:DNA-binding IclR family transcriptional regulator
MIFNGMSRTSPQCETNRVPIASIKSLEKAIDLVMLFSEKQPTLSLPQISAALKIPESTAYRLLRTLQTKHVIVRDAASKKYTLDASLLRLQASISSRLSINRLALPHLEDLAAQSGETVHLHLLQAHHMVLIEAVNSQNMIRFELDKGTVMPLHAPAGGRAILAFLPDKFLDEYLQIEGLRPFTPHTVTDPSETRQLLSEVRSRGFAVGSQQYYPATAAVAAPVFDHRQEAIASIAVAGPIVRFSEEDALTLAPLVCKHASELSMALGASMPIPPLARMRGRSDVVPANDTAVIVRAESCTEKGEGE